MIDVIVVIPALNEVTTIGILVVAAKQFGSVIVVDDGSTDGTGKIAWTAGAHVIRHAIPEGIGSSIIDGWRTALRCGAKRVVVMDAGGSHVAPEMPKLLRKDADLVIGSRFVLYGLYLGGFWWRRWGSRLVGILCNLAQGGPWIRDWSSGYRVYSAQAVKELLKLSYRAKMHAWQIEVLARVRELGMTVQEVPITYRAGRSSLTLAGIIELIAVWLLMLHHWQVYG